MPPRNGLRQQGHRVIVAVAALGLNLAGASLLAPSVHAEAASGLAFKWGKACKIRVAEQFDVPNSDAVVNLGATEQQSLNEGNTSLADIKKYGLSFNWEVRDKKISGYGNVNGKGTITEFKQGSLAPGPALPWRGWRGTPRFPRERLCSHRNLPPCRDHRVAGRSDHLGHPRPGLAGSRASGGGDDPHGLSGGQLRRL